MKASQFSDEQIVQILQQAERDDQTIGTENPSSLSVSMQEV